MELIYVVTDVELDGPTPGENSMLSFASVAVNAQGREIDNFEAVLRRLEEARPDPATMAWFSGHPEALAEATENPRAVEAEILRYVQWVRRLNGEPIFVAHPLALDGVWIDFYLRRFADIRLLRGPWGGERLFYDGCLCLRSFAAGKLGWTLRDCTPDNYRPEWLGDCRHTHKAIDDARAYANLLGFLLGLERAGPGPDDGRPVSDR